ncbi:MAG TPA: Crp/Fnr family transcriptional regulator, partial [Polyangiaceae bacterium]|nr:Crp/Fnr family transcriptional regulator [Polyangiaceae bacterium]
ELQDALVAAALPRRLAGGQRLFSRGDPPDGLYAVLDGAVRITATTEGGKEVLLTLIEAPTWFGEISVFDGRPRTHDAVADEDALVLHVPQGALDALLEREPRHWRDVGRLVAGKLRLALVTMEDIASLPLAARLARRLVLMAEGYGEWHDRSRRVLEVRQEQLALMLSTSRQTANQLLKDLAAQGLVRLAYGQVEVVDLEGLRRAAGLEAADARQKP